MQTELQDIDIVRSYIIYQNLWIGRLGYEPAGYLEAIGETLDALCDSLSVDQ